MDAAREERMQQRLRGSQRRQVKDVDFGLSFPVLPSLEEQPQSTQTNPPLELAPVLSTRRTPANRDKVVSAEGSGIPSTRSGNFNANTSAKRRKINIDEPSSSRSTRSRPAPIPDIYALAPDEPEETSVIEARQDEPEERTVLEVLLEPVVDQVQTPMRILSPELGDFEAVDRSGMDKTPDLRESVVQQVSESPTNAPGSGHRSRTIDRSLTTSSQLQSVFTGRPKRKFAESDINNTRREIAASPVAEAFQQQKSDLYTADSEDELDDLSLKLTGKPRKRRVIEVEEVPPVDQDQVLSEMESTEDLEEAEAIGDVQAAAILNRNRGRRNTRSFGIKASPDLDEAPSERSKPAKSVRRKSQPVAKASPRPQVKRKQKHAPKTVEPAPKIVRGATQKPAKRARLRDGSPISVTVHRLTKRPRYAEGDSDDEVLSSDIPFAKRPGVNAVDVFSQVCKEIVGSGLETLQEGVRNAEDPELKREYKTKWEALKSFGGELQSRLLSHTINLDNGYTLDKRVREQQKRKLALREDTLRIRAERQQLALRMDEVRINHENETKVAQERDNVNTAVHDIELAIDLGRASESTGKNGKLAQMSGVEVLLKRVGARISKKGDSGGILKQIKDFNGFLERAASALESKKG